MGMQTVPAQLFYDFCLDGPRPRRSPAPTRGPVLRDLGEVRTQLKAGLQRRRSRPSIDPELMMRMLIVGCCMGVRSERRLCE